MPYDIGFTNNGVFDFISFNNELYASGSFYSTTSSLDNIARWDGTNWNALGPGMLGGVYSMTIYNGELHAGGGFSNIPGVPNTKRIARWDGTSWHALHYGITSGTIQAISVYNGSLYIGGNITSVDSMSMRDIARWDGSAWYPVCTLSTGLTQLFSMAVFNNELYIGGYFDRVNGDTIYNIAKFDGTTWNDVGGGVNSDVFALFPDTVNNRLYAAGNFNYAGGGTVACTSNVAYWDGISWTDVGANGPALYPRAMSIYNNELYCGFVFPKVKANGDTLNGITRWDGTDWQPLGSGVNGSVQALLVFNSELAVGGGFTQAGDTVANKVAAWSYSPTAIAENYLVKEEIKIIPNPFTDELTVSSSESSEKTVPIAIWIKIWDVYGRIIYSQKHLTSHFTLHTSNWSNGIYFIQIIPINREDEERVVRKIVKQ